jgi:hypothetical protein
VVVLECPQLQRDALVERTACEPVQLTPGDLRAEPFRGSRQSLRMSRRRSSRSAPSGHVRGLNGNLRLHRLQSRRCVLRPTRVPTRDGPSWMPTRAQACAGPRPSWPDKHCDTGRSSALGVRSLAFQASPHATSGTGRVALYPCAAPRPLRWLLPGMTRYCLSGYGPTSAIRSIGNLHAQGSERASNRISCCESLYGLGPTRRCFSSSLIKPSTHRGQLMVVGPPNSRYRSSVPRSSACR